MKTRKYRILRINNFSCLRVVKCKTGTKCFRQFFLVAHWERNNRKGEEENFRSLLFFHSILYFCLLRYTGYMLSSQCSCQKEFFKNLAKQIIGKVADYYVDIILLPIQFHIYLSNMNERAFSASILKQTIAGQYSLR